MKHTKLDKYRTVQRTNELFCDRQRDKHHTIHTSVIEKRFIIMYTPITCSLLRKTEKVLNTVSKPSINLRPRRFERLFRGRLVLEPAYFFIMPFLHFHGYEISIKK